MQLKRSLSREDIAIGVTIINFGNFVGGPFSLVSCPAHFDQSSVRIYQDWTCHQSRGTGAIDLLKLVPTSQVLVLQAAYNKGINNVFYCALGVAGFVFVASCFVEWKSFNGKQGC